MALEVSWNEHMTNSEFLENQMRVSENIRVRKLEVAGHCIRHPEFAANPLILWEPSQGKALRANVLKQNTWY
jgi:hypothetical protein